MTQQIFPQTTHRPAVKVNRHGDLEIFKPGKSLSEYVDQREAEKHHGKRIERKYFCPKCEVFFRVVGSSGSKDCPNCGYARTVAGDD